MGLDINGVQFILYAQSLGVEFSRTAMIGRQGLHLNPSDFQAILVKFGFAFDEDTIDHVFKKNSGYAEEFFRCLGAKNVHAFDKSAYEGATHLHDMNQEIPENFKQQYSVVLDGGSLEHVFNFPVAIRNCMEMVRVGGHYLGITPANNFMGHGFYQFSPELYFSIFTGANGYKLVSVIAFEDSPTAEWLSVKSPASANSRITLTNSNPVYLLIVAKRVENITPFTSTPQQSDYISAWNGANRNLDASPTEPVRGAKHRNRLLAVMLRHTPDGLKRIVKWLLSSDRGYDRGFDPRFFQSIKRTDGIRSTDKTLERTR